MFINFHTNRSPTKSHPNKQSQDHKQHGLRLSQPISYQVNQPHKVPRFLLKVKLLEKSQLKTAQLTAHLQKLFACTGTSCLMLTKSSQAHWNSRTKIIPCCSAYKHDQWKMHLIWSVVMEHSTRICWANMIDLVYHPARYFPPPHLATWKMSDDVPPKSPCPQGQTKMNKPAIHENPLLL